MRSTSLQVAVTRLVRSLPANTTRPRAAMPPPAVVSETRSMSTPRPSAVTVPSPDEMVTPRHVRSDAVAVRTARGSVKEPVTRAWTRTMPLGRATSGCSHEAAAARSTRASPSSATVGAVPKTPTSPDKLRSAPGTTTDRVSSMSRRPSHATSACPVRVVPRPCHTIRPGSSSASRPAAPRIVGRRSVLKRRRSRAVSATSSRHTSERSATTRFLIEMGAVVDEATESSDDQFVDPSRWRISEMRAPATRSKSIDGPLKNTDQGRAASTVWTSANGSKGVRARAAVKPSARTRNVRRL